jgi:hypothetical protein
MSTIDEAGEVTRRFLLRHGWTCDARGTWRHPRVPDLTFSRVGAFRYQNRRLYLRRRYARRWAAGVPS